MHAPSVIEKKREGSELSDAEIREFIAGYTAGSIPDYQMSALAMAIYFRGMTPRETTALTRAMLESGSVFAYPESAPRVVDKHSTGGIGDKVSLILAPLLACDRLWVPMISGRGLGITGGTLDKLESIPRFNVFLSMEKTIAQLEQIGVAMIGQTPEVCPADKKLYALRDVTATVPSQPLIVASIMSKKLAESLDALVLDVKFGRGAFMKTRPEAESLAAALQSVGQLMGVETHVALHPMDEPLGRAVGNALEVAESLETLRGQGPGDLRKIVLDLAEKVSLASREQLESWLDNGAALAKFREIVAAQGGDVSSLDDFSRVHPASVILEVKSEQSGVVQQADAEIIGRACVQLGAGRSRADDVIDFSVGFDELVKKGQSLRVGDVIGRVHASNEAAAREAAHALRRAVKVA